MTREITRRVFVKESVLASAGTAIGAELMAKPLQAQQPATTGNVPSVPKGGTWTGKIGNLELSRLMLGGNLIGGWAHARDLRYVSSLMVHYNTPEKIMDTFALAEAHGVDSVNIMIRGDDSNIRELKRYWKERGGKIKWIAAANPSPMSDDLFADIDLAAREGAHAIYMQGVCADNLIRQKQMDLIKRTVDHMRTKGVPIGIGAHTMAVLVQCEKAKLDVDFYQKTLHTRDYPSAQRPEETAEFGSYDNAWCRNAEEVIEFMKTVTKPWLAFKVMAAGAITPRTAFPYAFNNGADFVLAGMLDFQIEEDVQIAKEALAKVNRTRPWRA